ncbi:MAG: bifunctional homocysteine S-methyltransferase/methylenetetrahydrofolate reductase, partial [Chloroflexi bacterium]
AGRDALVAGSVGPLGSPTHASDERDPARIRSAFREQIDGLLEGGADILWLETFSDLETLLIATEEAQRAADLPVVTSLTFGEELSLLDGTTPDAAAGVLLAAGVDVVGVNCGVGPEACLDALERTGKPTLETSRSILPNAGLPQRIAGQFVYAAGPEYFGAVVPRMLAAGARLIGGCCGTTPAHTAAMRTALDAIATADERRAKARADAATAVAPARPRSTLGGASPRASLVEAGGAAVGEAPPPTGLLEKLREGRFVISVEIDPPRSIRIERTIEAARLLQAAGVDVVNVSDSAMARVRMGAMAVAFGIQHDLDLECLVHFTTRDRNLMAIESELLGAHALGVRNIIALTGDPPRVGDYPTGTGVWDVDSIGLIEILTRLNRGEDQAGSPIGQRAGFTIACALDPTAADQMTEWDRLERKIEAGAHLIMTQPLYGMRQVEAMLTESRRRFGADGFPLPVLLGVLPLVSARHAEFLHNEVPGITIPDEAREAMHAAGERGADVGLELAQHLLTEAAPAVQGTYLMPSFGRYEQNAELVRRLRSELPTRQAGTTTEPGARAATRAAT